MKKLSSVSVKLFYIGVIIGGLCIANALIGGKMNERESTYRDAQNEISQSAGGSCKVKNVRVVIPYTKRYNNEGVAFTHSENIEYNVDLTSENRNLGIYHAPVYNGTIAIEAVFNLEKLTNTDEITYHPEQAYIILPVNSSSLMSKPEFLINNQKYKTSYINSTKDNTYGISCAFDASVPGTYTFFTLLNVRGASEFIVCLNSSETKMNIKSDWSSPGFTRYSYLPDTRKITDSGFTASWNIPFGPNNDSESIGFSFVEPANLYQKLHRAQNYAFLFIIVPFIVLFLFEIFFELNLHPVNYLLSGAASVIFFLLLLSMSEHIQFGLAYLLGAIASGLLVSFYVMSITKKVKLGGIMCLLFVLLYSYLFFCLQSEDYALLMGSIFAFVLLAVIMFITRKVNWSNLKKSNNAVLIEE